MPQQPSEALLEAYASPGPASVILQTIEVSHPAWDHPYYFVSHVVDQVLKLETGESVTFIACPFVLVPPDQDEGQAPKMSVTIDNIARDLIPLIEQAIGVRALLQVVWRQYLEDDPNTVQFGPHTFCLRDVSVTGPSVTGDVEVDDLQNRSMPRIDFNYTPQWFPSLLPQ